MDGQRSAMAGGPSATVDPIGTGTTGGLTGGRTVHLPSPLGEGIVSPSLTL